MLQLEPGNRFLLEYLEKLFNQEKPSSVDQSFVDFDSTKYHLSTQSSKSKNILTLSIEILCWADLVQHGARAVLEREYKDHILPEAETEQEFNVSLKIDLETLPKDLATRTQLLESFSLLKRNALAAPFEKAFEIQKRLEQNPPGPDEVVKKEDLMIVRYRPEEALYLLPSPDRVTAIFSTIFKEETDRIYGKVFLQEFVDARRRPSCQTAPQVLYTNREPPLEIRGVKGIGSLETGENVGYVTFVLFPRHFTPTTLPSTITQIQLFRDYLHYHIKCSKAYMHSRMRTRVASFLKVLNRAKLDAALGEGERERKTASGRSFVRA
ncbi:P34-Arc-domain-containing protein [Meredithblackwellia eburnea MCA 4105]